MNFHGCFVKISTISEMELEGKIDRVDRDRQDISLVDISARKHGKITHIPRMTLNSSEIVALRIINAEEQTDEGKDVLQEVANKEEEKSQARAEFNDPAIISYQKQHRTPVRPQRSKKNGGTVAASAGVGSGSGDGWAYVNAAEIHQTDFDFQGNLDKFDKPGIFAEFDKQPAPNHAPKQKHHPRRQQHPSDLQSTTFYAGSKRVPSATALQMAEAERVALEEFGLTSDMMTVHASRSIAEICLKILDNHPFFETSDLSSSPSPPQVLLLIGNHRSAAYTLSAALNLLHRGILVTVVLVTHHPLPILQTYVNRVRRENAEVLTNLDSVPQADLVVDALLGTTGFKDITHSEDRTFVCDVMELFRSIDAPILSIDVPSGVDASFGTVSFPGHVILPKWTLCLGIPKSGLINPSSTGALYLADIGFPNFVWSHIGIDAWSSPFSNQFIVPLKFSNS